MEGFIEVYKDSLWNGYYMNIDEKEITIKKSKISKEIYKNLLLKDCEINEKPNEKKNFEIISSEKKEKICINTSEKQKWLKTLKNLHPSPSQNTQNPKKKKPIFTQDLLLKNKVFNLYPIKNKLQKRKALPCTSHNISTNLWSLFKSNFGKLLSKITVPVHYNEPVTFLQKSSEIMEYRNLIRSANKSENKFKRIGLIFSAILFFQSGNINRVKKPFNPLLGETYEFFEGDFKMVLEQVSHHPPIHFLRAECDDFIFDYVFYVNAKMNLNGITATPRERSYVFLKRTKERFEIILPSVKCKNLVVGKSYIWFFGLLKIVNLNTGDFAEFHFKKKDMKSQECYRIEGFIRNKSEEVVFNIGGYWNSYVKILSAVNDEVLICQKLNPKIPLYEKMYYFSDFSINLNNLEKSMVNELPPTDSRLRPDLRAYEFGDIKLAAKEKERLEIKQRSKKKYNKKNKIVWKPKWFDFEFKKGKILNSEFRGDYWIHRNNNNWDKCENIFN